MRCVRGSALLFLSAVFLLSACNTKRVPIPDYQSSTPIEVPTGEHMEPIGLSKTLVSIKRGELIGAYFSGSSESSSGICNLDCDASIYWSSSRALIGGNDDEFSQYFYDALTAHGFNIVGDTKHVFDRDEELRRARYLIAADIKNLKANICRVHDFWTGRYEGTENGEVWMEVEWTVYSPLEKKSLMQVTTTGYQKSVAEKNEGFATMVFEAFAGAAEELGADSDFYAIVTGRSVKDKLVEQKSVGSEMIIPAVENYVTSFVERPQRVVDSAVTIRVGTGHGSGFLITKDGYIITNQHVVGESKKVAVVFSNGFELYGDVIRKHATRDVALIKVNLNSARPLPIRIAGVKVLESVYPVGTPYLQERQATITKGVVSALREDENTGLHLIQADADIQPGNSGGALVDENGNVVGVSVSGMSGPGGGSIGMNYFIPIKEALGALNIRLSSN